MWFYQNLAFHDPKAAEVRESIGDTVWLWNRYQDKENPKTKERLRSNQVGYVIEKLGEHPTDVHANPAQDREVNESDVFAFFDVT